MRPQGEPGGDLLRAAIDAHQGEPSEIGAGDEQDEADGQHERENGCPHLAAQIPGEWLRIEPGSAATRVGDLFKAGQAEPGDLRAGLLPCGSVVEPKQNAAVISAAFALWVAGSERGEELSVALASRAVRQHAHDGIGLALEGDSLPQHMGISCER